MTLHIDYALLAPVGVPTIIAIGSVCTRAISATDSLESRYGEKGRRAHSKLVAEKLSYLIGQLVVGILAATGLSSNVITEDDDKESAIETVADALQRRSFSIQVEEMLTLCDDGHVIRTSCEEMKRIRHLQAWTMIPLFPSSGFIIFWAAEQGILIQSGFLVLALILMSASLATFGLFAVIEMVIANRLAERIKKYA